MSKSVKLSCDLVSHNFVPADRLEELLSFLSDKLPETPAPVFVPPLSEVNDVPRCSIDNVPDVVDEQRHFVVDKVFATDKPEEVKVELKETTTRHIDREVMQGEKGVWKSYGSVDNVPVVIGTIGGDVYIDGRNMASFNFDANGGFTSQKLVNNDPNILEGLICPASGLLFLCWDEAPENSKIAIEYDYSHTEE